MNQHQLLLIQFPCGWLFHIAMKIAIASSTEGTRQAASGKFDMRST